MITTRRRSSTTLIVQSSRAVKRWKQTGGQKRVSRSSVACCFSPTGNQGQILTKDSLPAQESPISEKRQQPGVARLESPCAGRSCGMTPVPRALSFISRTGFGIPVSKCGLAFLPKGRTQSTQSERCMYHFSSELALEHSFLSQHRTSAVYLLFGNQIAMDDR